MNENRVLLGALAMSVVLTYGACGPGNAGGDLNIGFSGSHWTPRIDAHPKSSGDFQCRVVVNSREVFLTREGCDEYERILKTGYRAYVFSDSAGGYFSAPTPEQHFVGKP